MAPFVPSILTRTKIIFICKTFKSNNLRIMLDVMARMLLKTRPILGRLKDDTRAARRLVFENVGQQCRTKGVGP